MLGIRVGVPVIFAKEAVVKDGVEVRSLHY